MNALSIALSSRLLGSPVSLRFVFLLAVEHARAHGGAHITPVPLTEHRCRPRSEGWAWVTAGNHDLMKAHVMSSSLSPAAASLILDKSVLCCRLHIV